MKKFNVIMNGTPLNDYEMDEIFGGDNVNCQNAVKGCCISNHTEGCGTANPSGCLINSSKFCYEPINLCPVPIDGVIECKYQINGLADCTQI